MIPVPRSVDHLVIGGGPAGAMIALRLANAGRLCHRALNAPLCSAMTLATWLSRAAVTRAGRGSALPALSLFPSAMR